MMNMNTLKRADQENITRLLDDFSKMTGAAFSLFAKNALTAFIEVVPKNSCAKFHSRDSTSANNCEQFYKNQLTDLSSSSIYYKECPYGFACAFAPLIIKDQHVASLCATQLLPQSGDLKQYRSRAAELGFETQEYSEFLEKTTTIGKGLMLAWMEHLTKLLTTKIESIIAINTQLEKDNLPAFDISKRSTTDSLDTLTTPEKPMIEALGKQDLSLAMKAVGIAMMDWNVAANTAVLSEHYMEWLGYKTGQLPNTIETWRKLIHPQDINKVAETIDESLRTRSFRWSIEFRIRTAADGYRWILSKGNMIEFSPSGEPLRCLGIHLDITARKQAEQAVQAKEQKYRDLFNNMASGVLICSAEKDTSNFIVEDLNNAAQNMTNTTLDDVLGKNILAVLSGAGSCGIMSALQRVNATSEPISLPRCYYSDGINVLWLNGYIYMLQSGKLVIIFNDISAEEYFKKELRLQKKQLKQIVDLAADAFFLVNSEQVIVQTNQSASQLTGYTREELIGQHFTFLYSEEDHQRVAHLPPPPQNGITVRRERIWSGKNGKKFTIELQAKAMPDGGYQGFARDITERKQHQQDLLDSQTELKKKKAELEETNIALRVLIKKAEEEKEELKERITANTLCLVNPYVEKLKKTDLTIEQRKNVQIIESTLANLISPFTRSAMLKNVKLSQTELKVANLIKQGKRTKEIADILCVSPQTINKHRSNIRRKMGLKNRNTSISDGI